MILIKNRNILFNNRNILLQFELPFINFLLYMFVWIESISQNLSFSSILQTMLTINHPMHQAYYLSSFNQSNNNSSMRLVCTPNSALSRDVRQNIKRSAGSHEKTVSDLTLIKSATSSKMIASKREINRIESKLPLQWEMMKDQSIELTSPNVGLKVRKLKRKTQKFHNNFKRDEVLHFFANQPVQQKIDKSQKIFQIHNLDRNKYRKQQIIQNKPVVKWAEDQFQYAQKEPKQIIQPPFSSNLSGWRAQSSETNKTTALQAQCQDRQDPVRYMPRMPSINLGISQRENSYRATNEDEIEITANQRYSQDEENYTSGSSMVQLPQESLKLVPPSESSCHQSPISINIKEESLSEVPMRQLSQNTVSHQAISSKNSKFNLVSKHSLKNVFNLQSKEEIKCKEISKMSIKSIKSSKIEPITQNHTVNMEKNAQNSDSAGFSYREDNHSHQRADEGDKIRSTEKEMNYFTYQSPKKCVKSRQEVKKDIQNDRKRSVVVEKIEQFGQNCKNFFTNVAAILNPMKIFNKQSQIDPIAQQCTVNECQEESLMDSVPILHTLNSKIGSHKHVKNQGNEHHVSIRQATMQITQGWCNEDNIIIEREGTFHEMKMPSNDFMTQMRLNLMAKEFNNQSFYSELSIDIDLDSIKSLQHFQCQDIKYIQHEEIEKYLVNLTENISKEVTSKTHKIIKEIVDAEINYMQERILDQYY